MNNSLQSKQKGIPTIIIALSDKLKAELIATLESEHLFTVVNILTDGENIFEVLTMEKPDYLLIDNELPNSEGFGFLKKLARLKPKTKVIIYSKSTNPDYLKVSITSSISGFIQQGCGISEFTSCLKTIFDGEKVLYYRQSKYPDYQHNYPTRKKQEMAYDLSILTKREMDIWELLQEGKKEKEIAELLFIDKTTVRKHKNNISGKLELKGKIKLTTVALRFNLYSN